MPAANPGYPFAVTIYGKDIAEIRENMVLYLADNVAPGAVPPKVSAVPDTSEETQAPQEPKKTRAKNSKTKPRKTAKKAKADDNSQEKPETPDAPEAPDTAPDTPAEHPDASISYNAALEILMDLYNGSPEGAYEVTLLLEQYRVASFREIPEERGTELLDKANGIKEALSKTKDEAA